jgi:hypothetical protein
MLYRRLLVVRIFEFRTGFVPFCTGQSSQGSYVLASMRSYLVCMTRVLPSIKFVGAAHDSHCYGNPMIVSERVRKP